jgi:hypothetical protein
MDFAQAGLLVQAGAGEALVVGGKIAADAVVDALILKVGHFNESADILAEFLARKPRQGCVEGVQGRQAGQGQGDAFGFHLIEHHS